MGDIGLSNCSSNSRVENLKVGERGQCQKKRGIVAKPGWRGGVREKGLQP